ncbi:MAG: SMP-30/gluconolactonase/LRE family protein [Spirosomataceae bacterium]|jgi:gluconolactonase
MKKKLVVLNLISIVFMALLQSFSQEIENNPLVKKGAKLNKISSQFKFTEGPAVDKKGNVFFTDQPNNTIWKYDTKGNLSLFLENSGRSNGLFFDKKGILYACADENNQLWAIDEKGNHTVLLENYEGKLLNGPNDLWIDASGGIYFTDPFYPREYWKRKNQEIEEKRLYYLPKNAKVAKILDADFKQPNGIVGSGDGKYLYVADIGASKTYRYEITGTGQIANRQLFAEMGSDGMTTDSEGNLYLTGKGVTIFDKAGKKIGHIPVPAGWTANVTFGGKKRNLLFITALESVYTLEMNVKGVN